MSAASAVIIAVAEELAKQVRNEMPKGEKVVREWLDGDMLYQLTEDNGLNCFDLRRKTFQRRNADG